MTDNLLVLAELQSEGLRRVLDLAAEPSWPHLLERKGVALLFEHPSLRTRNAFEMAIVDLGGHPVYMKGEEVGIGVRESAEDVARTLARYHALIAARVARHGVLDEMAAALHEEKSSVPLVNLLSDVEHPTEAVADLLTMRARFGRLAGLKLAYLGDFNNVARSLVSAAALSEMELAVASPEGFGPSPGDIAQATALGGRFEVSSSPRQAVAGADVVYTDVWVSMGEEAQGAAKREAFDGFQVTSELVALASPGAVVMHCLPAHRGEEIAADVFEANASVIFEQAAQRRHAARAIIWHLLSDGGGE